MEIIVKNDDILLKYLYNNLDLSKKKIKSYLTHGSVFINNVRSTKYDYKLCKGMKIVIDTNQSNSYKLPFDIVYEDNFIIVVNKPSGLLTIATSKEKQKTLYHYVSNYLKKKNKNNKVFIVHRLDKDTSGIVILAKDIKTKNKLQKDWNSLVSVREYVAIVSGIPKKNEDRLVNFLKETKTNYVYISKNNEGKEAITNYKVKKIKNNKSLLKINIETGRKNQIRVQLANINCPILGDKKYFCDSKGTRLFLHANKIKLFYPVIKKEIVFKTDIPEEFQKML